MKLITVLSSRGYRMSKADRTNTLPCGCVYEDDGYMIVRIRECEYHRKRRTRKREYRPKAECVRP